MKACWLCRSIVVFAMVALGNSARAEDLGFPDGCIELEGVPPNGCSFDTFSRRDSVLFALERSTGLMLKKSDPHWFIAWDTETGKRLARLPALEATTGMWKFSPDGKLLAVPVENNGKIVQLWEVGSKDIHGVPQLRFLKNLHQRKYRTNELRNVVTPLGDWPRLAWTPDSKTLLVALCVHSADNILFWSYTDKPSIWSSRANADHDLAWKPWAKLDFDSRVEFTVSPDNRTLAVIRHGRRQGDGQLFDLSTAKEREQFELQRGPERTSGTYRLAFSPDNKTLLVTESQYLALWDSEPLASRVEIRKPDSLEFMSLPLGIAFTADSRWLLTPKFTSRKDDSLLTGGVLQIRDAQNGERVQEVSFPKQLGLLNQIDSLPDGRVRTRFVSRKQSQEIDTREFLWHTEDLLSYAAEHGSKPR